MTKPTNEIAIIGAGPYGLSAASHLRSAGFKTVVFGKAMEFWKEQMPHGMRLRSSWDASHISDPQRAWTLDAYQQDQGIKVTTPIPIADFIQYGEWFQRRAASDLDSRRVREISTCHEQLLPGVRGWRGAMGRPGCDCRGYWPIRIPPTAVLRTAGAVCFTLSG